MSKNIPVDTSKLSRATLEAMVHDLSTAGSVVSASIETTSRGPHQRSNAVKDAARGARVTPAKTAPKRARAVGVKRAPAELEQLVGAVERRIVAHPGESIEQIGAAMGLPTRELSLPVKKLLAAKRISRTGKKRATKYAGPRAARAAAPKPRKAAAPKVEAKAAPKTPAKKMPPKKLLNGAAAHA